MTATIRIEGLDNLKGALQRFPDETRKAAMRGMRQGVLRVQRSAREKAPVDTGHLRRSIATSIRSMARGVLGIVGTAVKYAPFREFGTRPHFVPKEYIGLWAKRHGFGYTGLRVSGRATPFLRPGLEENVRAVVADLVREIRIAIERLAR